MNKAKRAGLKAVLKLKCNEEALPKQERCTSRMFSSIAV
jgi:hypothetical protein